MSDPYVAVVVKVPEEYFPDGDDICLTAGNYVCARLESQLSDHGHSVPKWIQGGCEEDWGVFFKSHWKDQAFAYSICFFPVETGQPQCWMMIQSHLVPAWFATWRKLPTALDANHPLHKMMQAFGKTFGESRMLTQSQFDAEF